MWGLNVKELKEGIRNIIKYGRRVKLSKFLFLADLHLRRDVPVCRNQSEEEWAETQFKQLSFIASEAKKRYVPIIIGGDIFHTPTVIDSIKNLFFNAFAFVKIYVIAGQHDCLHHSIKYIDSTSFGTLLRSFKVDYPNEFGQYQNYNEPLEGKDTGLYFLHRLVFPDKKSMPPTERAVTASELLKEYPDAKWILLGDMHKNFHYQENGRHVIMAGCLNRQAVDFKDYQPVIWYIDTDKEIVEQIPVPDEVEIVENAKVKAREEAKSRIGAWMEIIKDKKSMSFDYKSNVLKEMKTAEELTDGAKDIIRGYLNANI